MLAPSHLRERSQEEAHDLVIKHNTQSDVRLPVKSERMLSLITQLTALMLQVKVRSCSVCCWSLFRLDPVQDMPCQHWDLNVHTAVCVLYSGLGGGAPIPGCWSRRQLNFVQSCVIFFQHNCCGFLVTYKNVYQFRYTEHKVLDKSEVHRSLHNWGSPVWNLPHVTHLVSRTWGWLLDFWKICEPLG